jgi:hypothetical protein
MYLLCFSLGIQNLSHIIGGRVKLLFLSSAFSSPSHPVAAASPPFPADPSPSNGRTTTGPRPPAHPRDAAARPPPPDSRISRSSLHCGRRRGPTSASGSSWGTWVVEISDRETHQRRWIGSFYKAELAAMEYDRWQVRYHSRPAELPV